MSYPYPDQPPVDPVHPPTPVVVHSTWFARHRKAIVGGVMAALTVFVTGLTTGDGQLNVEDFWLALVAVLASFGFVLSVPNARK